MAFTPPSLDEFSREVGASAQEFERSLHAALPGGVESLGNGSFRVSSGDVCLEITAAPQAPRRIGLFALPVLQTHFRFLSGAREARAALIARLDRAMQRGGG
ncbi:hypothetical protein [Denitromonas iodatirespirans]|uniref:Uncharacterized protein n=1 Tax=Denitromonas iodatirespirans TaxID=2795389 RepID=A0A944D6Z7_DENI1|nr:hypothetical protein [Denitromonas iodatirespirans]MBT0961170.1 hypothetical protein [Denitromonas iodatirespirans]